MHPTTLAFIQSALLVFLLRVVDISLYTLRIKTVARGRKLPAWLFGLTQSLVYLTALRVVLSDLGNWGKVIGYAAGFATGMVVGMWIEERLAIGYTHLRVISPRRGAELVERLRSRGYGVTEISAQGRDGTVSLINLSVLRKQAQQALKIVEEVDPQAFVTAEAVRSVRRGFWGA